MVCVCHHVLNLHFNPSIHLGASDLGEFWLSVATDAVTKLGRFAKCGTKSKADAVLTAFFAAAQATIDKMTAAGDLNLHAALHPDGGNSEDEADDCSDDGCPLHCARPSALASKLSIHGLVGMVCVPHSIPLLGSFADMTTPEQFVYYLVILAQVLAGVNGADIKVCLLCRTAIRMVCSSCPFLYT